MRVLGFSLSFVGCVGCRVGGGGTTAMEGDGWGP